MSEGETAPAPGTFQMYGAEFSFYSAKLRSYLEWKRIPWVEVTPDWRTFREFIEARTGVRYIPVLQTPDDQVWQDTAVIIGRLEARFAERPVLPPTPRQRLAAELLSLFGDEWLILPAMHYRWNFPDANRARLEADFGAVAFPRLPGFLQRWLGRRIARRFAGFVPGLGIDEATGPALEKAFAALVVELEAHFARHPFVLGAHPSLPDFSLAGAFLGHLARDPYPAEWLGEHAPRTLEWAARMRSVAKVDARWPPDDEIPDTALPLLQRMAREQLPVLADCAAVLDRWAADQPPGSEVPRTLGRHPVKLFGVESERRAIVYPLWRLQCIREGWLRLEGRDRAAADRFLDGVGILSFLLDPPRTRLVRRDNRLWLDEGAPRSAGTMGC